MVGLSLCLLLAGLVAWTISERGIEGAYDWFACIMALILSTGGAVAFAWIAYDALPPQNEK